MARATRAAWRPRMAIGMVAAGTLLLAACVPTRLGENPNMDPDPPTLEFVIVRHAEKAGDDPRDPSLSTAGLARAQRLATTLSAAAPMTAAYATAYRRTQQTATPAAAAQGLAVSTYDAGQDATAFAAVLRQRHAGGTVLVVGHSNTAAAIAAALCGCVVTPVGDDEFDRLLRVHIDARGKATLRDGRQP